MKKLLLVASVVAASIGFVPRVADAAPGGALTAVDGVFTGTTGDDTLHIGTSGNFYVHNHGSDPGFASQFDFDSTVEGEQKETLVLSGALFGFKALEGNDVLSLSGPIGFPLDDENLLLGAGTDTIDFSGKTEEGAGFGSNFDTKTASVEKIVGTPMKDVFHGSDAPDAPGITIIAGAGDDEIVGTANNDVLDGGAGKNQIGDREGDDLIIVSAPLQNGLVFDPVSPGNDTVEIRGTEATDVFRVVNNIPQNDEAPGKVVTDATGHYYMRDIEHLRVLGLGGNDSFTVEPLFAGEAIYDGGPGTDGLVVNAHEMVAEREANPEGGVDVTVPGYETLTVRGMEDARVGNETSIVTGAGPGGAPHVRTFSLDGTPAASFYAYDAGFTGGVNVALGDLDGQGQDEIVTAPGPRGGPLVRVFNGDGALRTQFYAYATGFTGGVNVATGDLDGNGVEEIITTPASAGGPHVKIFDGNGTLLDEWFADGFASNGLRAASVNAERIVGVPFEESEVLISPASGPGRVAAFFADGERDADFQDLFPYTAAFGGGVDASWATFTASDDAEALVAYDVVTGAGPGGAPHVRSFEWTEGGFTSLASFFAYGEGFQGGVDVSRCSPDGDADLIITAPGAGGSPHVRVFDESGDAIGPGFFAYGEGFPGGVHMACGAAGLTRFI